MRAHSELQKKRNPTKTPFHHAVHPEFSAYPDDLLGSAMEFSEYEFGLATISFRKIIGIKQCWDKDLEVSVSNGTY